LQVLEVGNVSVKPAPKPKPERRVAGAGVEDVVARFKTPLSRAVVRIVLENLQLVRQAVTERELYYLVRNTLARVDEDLYREFSTKEAYNYFLHDILNRLEAWGFITKPPADPVGFAIVGGVERVIREVLRVVEAGGFKGIIYVEKRSAAERLRPLSELGFVIIGGKGFPTRLMREIAKRGQLYVYHDADKSGNDIYRVFVEGAKRLKRISEEYAARWIAEHAKDVGLFYDDAVRLGLDPEPEARGRAGRRYELEALYAKLSSMGVQEPHVAYVAHQLEKRYGVRLRPEVADPAELYKERAKMLLYPYLSSLLESVAESAVREVLEPVQRAGQALVEGGRLREDLLRMGVRRLYENFVKELSKGLEISISDSDLAVAVAGIRFTTEEEEFEKKFKERYGVDKVHELLG